ncbi:MAG: hypothetical protein ACRC6E_13045 [Fusobacteriaceae bacterium]
MYIYLIPKYTFYYELGVFDIEKLEKYLEKNREPNYNALLEHTQDIKEIERLIDEATKKNVEIDDLINTDNLY